MITLKRLQLALISAIVLSGIIANVYYLMKYYKLLVTSALHNEVMAVTLQSYLINNCLGIWLCCLFWLIVLQVVRYFDYI